MALSVSYPFGNPRLIPLPTSRLGYTCTIMHNMCLRSTLCDAVVLFTVQREIVLKNRKSLRLNVLKLSMIYTMYNLYPLLIFMLVINITNCIVSLHMHWYSVKQSSNIKYSKYIVWAFLFNQKRMKHLLNRNKQIKVTSAGLVQTKCILKLSLC